MYENQLSSKPYSEYVSITFVLICSDGSSVSYPEVTWPKKKKIVLNPGQVDFRPAAVCYVSVTGDTGLDTLAKVLQDAVMAMTSRKRVEMLVPADGAHYQWLRAHCCVEQVTGVDDYSLRINAIVTKAQLDKFLHNFTNVQLRSDIVNDSVS